MGRYTITNPTTTLGYITVTIGVFDSFSSTESLQKHNLSPGSVVVLDCTQPKGGNQQNIRFTFTVHKTLVTNESLVTFSSLFKFDHFNAI